MNENVETKFGQSILSIPIIGNLPNDISKLSIQLSSGSCILQNSNIQTQNHFFNCIFSNVSSPNIGPLNATITIQDYGFLENVQIATIISDPTISLSISKIAQNAQKLTIFGSGFNPLDIIVNLQIEDTNTIINCNNNNSASTTQNQIICQNLNLNFVGKKIFGQVITFGVSTQSIQVAQIVASKF